MANENQEVFGKAYIAQGNGDLVTVTDFSVTLTNNAQQKHTLRRKGAGITLGTEESTVTFNFLIGGTNGFERSFLRDCQRGTIRQLRAKMPDADGKVLTYDGVYQSVDINGPLDDAVNGSATFIGKLESQAA